MIAAPQLCQQAMEGVGNGVAASLQGVDCAANAMSQAAFGRLFGSDGALLPALTILLTLYVAFFAFALITGRSRIGIASLTPRFVTLGLVLTFATSWIAYQSVVWNLAVGAPDQIAGILMGTQGSATTVFAQKIDVVFGVIAELGGGQQADQPTTTFSPEGLMWLGAMLLLLGTVGLLVTARIALAVLLALGPIFVVLALFPATRGLFAGWLKGVVMLAVAPLFAVLGGSLMLELAVPVLNILAPLPNQIEPRAAMAFFMIGAVHCALMAMVLKTMGTMVGQWSVFGFASAGAERGSPTETQVNVSSPPVRLPAQSGDGAGGANRTISLSGVSAQSAANDGNTGLSGTGRSTVKIVTTGDHQSRQPDTQPVSRVRGIGSRFRAAPALASEKAR